MAWINFRLPLDEEWQVEKQARAFRECDDIEKLRAVAEQLFRGWVQQSDLVVQLIQQLADAEALLMQSGIGEPVDEHYLEWAHSLYPGDQRSGHN